jgi:hypothetical protein
MIVQPFPSFFLGTMASADFLQFVVTTEDYPACKTSSGKHYHLHLVYLLHLHLEIRAVLDFVLSRKLVRFKYALYVVSVRQTEVLPIGNFSSLNPASFRLHLTMDALAFG